MWKGCLRCQAAGAATGLRRRGGAVWCLSPSLLFEGAPLHREPGEVSALSERLTQVLPGGQGRAGSPPSTERNKRAKAGEPGFEPGTTDPKSAVLPLHHSPRRAPAVDGRQPAHAQCFYFTPEMRRMARTADGGHPLRLCVSSSIIHPIRPRMERPMTRAPGSLGSGSASRPLRSLPDDAAERGPVGRLPPEEQSLQPGQG